MPCQDDERFSTHEAIRSFARLSPSVLKSLEHVEGEWAPDLPPATIAMASIGEYIASAAHSISEGELTALIRHADMLMSHNLKSVVEAVATGFWEALLAESSAGRFDFRSIVHLMGEKSLQYCREWDTFSGIQTRGLHR